MKTDIFKKIWDKAYFFFLAAAIFWPLLFLNKGIDITDTSYCLIQYKWFFRNLSTMNIGFFYTNFLGGLIYRLIPSGHLLVFKLLFVLVNGTSMIFAFLTFKRYFQKNTVAFLIMGGSFALSAYPLILSYNTFSVFVLSLSIYLLQLGMEKNRPLYYLISGIIIGFGTFFRLPNVLFAALYFVVLLHDILLHQKRRILKDTVMMLAGGISGFLTALIGMIAATGMKNVQNSFAEYFIKSTANTANTNDKHNFGAMFQTMTDQLRSAVPSQGIFIAAGTFFGLFFCFFFARYLKKGKNIDKIFSVLSVVAIGLSVFAVEFVVWSSYLQPFQNMALILFPIIIIIIILYWKKEPKFSIVSLLTLVIALSIPIGTDNGFFQYTIVSFWLVPYLGCITIEMVKRLKDAKGNVFWRSVAATVMIVISTVTVFYGIKKEGSRALTTQYREADYRQMNYYPKNKVYAGVATTRERGLILDGIHQFFEENNCESIPVLSVNNIPAVHLMLDNPIAIPRKSWIDLRGLADETVFEALTPDMRSDDLPIIIDRHGDMLAKSNQKKYEYIMDFCKKMNYQTAVHEDVGNGEGYTILVPPTFQVKQPQ